jgi:hypothetical protein
VCSVKKYKFRVKRLYVNGDLVGCYVKSVSSGNVLYIYVYERGLFRDTLLLSLKVWVYE